MSENKALLATIYLRANQTTYVTCRIEIEGLVKVTGSDVRSKSCYRPISETVQNSNVITTDQPQEVICDLSNRNCAFPMSLSDFQGHTPIASVLKCDFSYTTVQQLKDFN